MIFRPEPALVGIRWIGNRPHHVWSDGTVLPLIGGGEGPVTPPGAPGNPNPAPPAPTPPPPPPPPAGGVPQEQVTAIAAREKEEGRRAAIREVQDLLGCTPEEAKAALDRQREAERQQMSDAERAKADAETAKAEAEADRQKARTTLLQARVTSALILSGLSLPAEAQARQDRLAAVARMVDVSDPDEAKVVEAVEKLKASVPEMFTGAPGASPIPSGTPGGSPPPPKPDADAYARGAERAKGYRPGSLSLQ